MKDNLTAIIETTALLKQANCEDHVRLSELARELGTTKTRLMGFINSHPGLFATYEPDTGHRGAGKNPGLLIADAFPSEELNWSRPAHADYLREKYRRTVLVKGYSEYDVLKGYYLPVDTPPPDWDPRPRKGRCTDYRKNRSLWRNTAEKLAEIAASGHCRSGYYWGGGDGMSRIEFSHCVDDADLRALEAEGWTVAWTLEA